MVPTKESIRQNRTGPAGCIKVNPCAVTRLTRTGASVRGLSRESRATIRFKRLHPLGATARPSRAWAPHRPRGCPCASMSAATALAGRKWRWQGDKNYCEYIFVHDASAYAWRVHIRESLARQGRTPPPPSDSSLRGGVVPHALESRPTYIPGASATSSAYFQRRRSAHARRQARAAVRTQGSLEGAMHPCSCERLAACHVSRTCICGHRRRNGFGRTRRKGEPVSEPIPNARGTHRHRCIDEGEEGCGGHVSFDPFQTPSLSGI